MTEERVPYRAHHTPPPEPAPQAEPERTPADEQEPVVEPVVEEQVFDTAQIKEPTRQPPLSADEFLDRGKEAVAQVKDRVGEIGIDPARSAIRATTDKFFDAIDSFFDAFQRKKK